MSRDTLSQDRVSHEGASESQWQRPVNVPVPSCSYKSQLQVAVAGRLQAPLR